MFRTNPWNAVLITFSLVWVAACGTLLTPPNATPIPAGSDRTPLPSPVRPTAASSIPTRSLTVQPTSDVSPVPLLAANSGLREVLDWTPRDADVVFTDWQGIKTELDATTLSSRSPLTLRTAFIQEIDQSYWMQTSFGIGTMLKYPQVWGWDVTDALWEGQVNLPDTDQTTIYMLRFPNDVDLAQHAARFTERAYQQRSYQNATLYTHGRDGTQDWLQPPADAAILNVAVVPTQHMMLFSQQVTALHVVLDAAMVSETLGTNPVVQTMIQQVGQLTSALIRSGKQACSRYDATTMFDQPFIRPKISTQLHTQFDATVTQLHPYQAMMFAYRRAQDRPLGLFAFTYVNQEAAIQDKVLRQKLATDGYDPRSQQLYSKLWFTVVDSTAEYGTLQLILRPVDDHMQSFTTLLLQRSLFFAMCPSA